MATYVLHRTDYPIANAITDEKGMLEFYVKLILEREDRKVIMTRGHCPDGSS